MTGKAPVGTRCGAHWPKPAPSDEMALDPFNLNDDELDGKVDGIE